MRLLKLHLKAFGPFTDRSLDFGTAAQGLVLVHGPNEAGKSSTLRAISDLRFGIPVQSKDNFVHEHSDMRIGGEFVDRHGKKYSLMRRKGRSATLLYADFDPDGHTADDPVPPEVEALLTCGLTKEAYETMFGLDHRRLREGGKALLKGEGEVGAALFEASAGVRSIPQVLERLDASARRFFMPGARGKNARINEALKAYDEHYAEFRRAQVRPAHWAEIFKKHQSTASQLAELEARRAELNGELLLIKELRAVAPLLSTLDNATQILEDLKSVTLLSANAATDRAAAESGQAAAQHNASIAAAEVTRQQQRLGELHLDAAILAVGPAVRRLAASAEAIDQYRRDIAAATVDVASETDQVASLAARIDASLGSDQVLAIAPVKAQRAVIDERLRGVEVARQALDQHLESGRQSAETNEFAPDALPSAESRTALRIAQAEVTQSNADLKRLAALPGEIKSARRAVASALDALGLSDETALRRVRPLFDAQIDSAMTEENGNATRRAGLEARIGEISQALPAAIEERDRLLAQGALATRDDVEAARSHRESGWALVRGIYIDGTSPPIDSFAVDRPLAQAYEEAVARADRLVDELASDTERAAQLQAAKRATETLELDRAELERQLEGIHRDEQARQRVWDETLASAYLPPLSPAALRDWQALLPAASAAFENLQGKLDEFEQVQATEHALATRLRVAIVETGLAMPAAEASLSTLSATAADLDEIIRHREAAINHAAGKGVERERQRQEWVARESKLKAVLQTAKEPLKPILTGLLLSDESSVAVVRARVAEFDDIVEAQVRLAAAQARKHRAEQGLLVLADSAKGIRESLGDAEAGDLRLYIERVVGRLDAAETVQAARALAQHLLDNALVSLRDHEQTAKLHQKALTTLCEAAGVESVNLLPEAEEQSRRKREALNEVDRSRNQLAQVSRRSSDELRALLADQDAARMDADEASCTQEQIQVEEKLDAAREYEERTRRDLEAIDGSDTAAAAREAMERAAASVRMNMPAWIRSKLAHALLTEALKRFRDRAQGPMLMAASGYFERMTQGAFVRLLSNDSGTEPVLIAQRCNGLRIRVEEMSEGTLDQLYLSLRLAAVDIRRAAGVDVPVILDDVLMSSDEERSGATLEALADFARKNQVIVFTHHRHIAEVAAKHVPGETLALVAL